MSTVDLRSRQHNAETNASSAAMSAPAAAAPQRRVRKPSRAWSMKQAVSQDAPSGLQHNAMLDIYSEPASLRSTGIICTIGPKTKSPEMITELRKAGLNVVRMNFSHGSYEYHGEVCASHRARSAPRRATTICAHTRRAGR